MPSTTGFLIKHLVLNVNAVRAAAARYNGRCTWEFSQNDSAVRTVISKSKHTSGGICEILAAKWICEDVRGSSLRAWLTTAGGSLDNSKLALLAQVFGTGREEKDGAKQQLHTEHWMLRNGVSVRKVGDVQVSSGLESGGGAPGAKMKFDVKKHLLADFRAKINRAGIVLPLHALLSVAEENRLLGEQGHTMALKVRPINARGIQIFDPNIGEFEFNGWDNFESWFLYFFDKANYGWCMGKEYKLRYF